MPGWVWMGPITGVGARRSRAATGAAPPRRERSTERSASAASIAPSARSSSKEASAPTSTLRVGAQRLTRAGDRRRDRQPLLQRVAQRGDLAVRVEPVLARRALRLGIAETPLPGAERVRADVEDGSRFRCLQRAHEVGIRTPEVDASRVCARCMSCTVCTISELEAMQLELDMCTLSARPFPEAIHDRRPRMYVGGR